MMICRYPTETTNSMRQSFIDPTTGPLPALYRHLYYNMTSPEALASHIELGSFIDYFLHAEASLNQDAYRRSVWVSVFFLLRSIHFPRIVFWTTRNCLSLDGRCLVHGCRSMATLLSIVDPVMCRSFSKIVRNRLMQDPSGILI